MHLVDYFKESDIPTLTQKCRKNPQVKKGTLQPTKLTLTGLLTRSFAALGQFCVKIIISCLYSYTKRACKTNNLKKLAQFFSNGRNQFQCHKIVFNNKTRPLFF